MYKHTK